MTKWKFKINIKDMFEEETSPELIVKLCESLIRQLNSILKRITSVSFSPEDSFYFSAKLFEIIEHFEFLKSFADGTISKEEWEDYDFYGDYEEMFNGYLDELYDLGDETFIDKTKKIKFKFLWIG